MSLFLSNSSRFLKIAFTFSKNFHLASIALHIYVAVSRNNSATVLRYIVEKVKFFCLYLVDLQHFWEIKILSR